MLVPGLDLIPDKLQHREMANGCSHVDFRLVELAHESLHIVLVEYLDDVQVFVYDRRDQWWVIVRFIDGDVAVQQVVNGSEIMVLYGSHQGGFLLWACFPRSTSVRHVW